METVNETFEQETGKEVELVHPAQGEIVDRVEAALVSGQSPDFLFGGSAGRGAARWAYEDRLAELEVPRRPRDQDLLHRRGRAADVRDQLGLDLLLAPPFERPAVDRSKRPSAPNAELARSEAGTTPCTRSASAAPQTAPGRSSTDAWVDQVRRPGPQAPIIPELRGHSATGSYIVGKMLQVFDEANDREALQVVDQGGTCQRGGGS